MPEADERDCLELAGAIATSVENYDSDYLLEVIVPHLKPIVGRVQELEENNADLLASLEITLPFVEHAEKCEASAEDVLSPRLAMLRRILNATRATIRKAKGE